MEFFICITFLVASTVFLAAVPISSLFFHFNKYQLPLNVFIAIAPLEYEVCNWYLNYCYQTLVLVVAGQFLFVYFPMTMLLMNHSCWGFDVIILEINKLRSDLSNRTANEEKDFSFRNRFKLIIERTQSTMEFQNSVAEFLKFNFLLEFSIMSFLLCMCLLMFTSNPYGSSVVYMIMQITLFQFFIYCSMGNRLIERFEKLSEALYDLQWFEMEIPRQREVQFVLVMSHNLRGFNGIFNKVNVETLQKVLQFTYSLYALLRSTNK